MSPNEDAATVRGPKVRIESDDPKAGYSEVALQVPYPKEFIYSNIASFSVSLMDIRIGFGEFLPDGNAVAKVGIVMPPEQCAVLAMMLLSQVNSYETNFGKIRDPRWRAFADSANERMAQAVQELAQDKQDKTE